MKWVRCRRCFFFSEPSSGEPPGSEAEAFSESGGRGGGRSQGAEACADSVAPGPPPLTAHSHPAFPHGQMSPPGGIELLSPLPPVGGALTAVLLALAAVFGEGWVGSARI